MHKVGSKGVVKETSLERKNNGLDKKFASKQNGQAYSCEEETPKAQL